jgi:hypothetical protein
MAGYFACAKAGGDGAGTPSLPKETNDVTEQTYHHHGAG